MAYSVSGFDQGENSFARRVFPHDPVMRFQFENVHGSPGGLASQQGLKALLFAVLEDGIACYQGYFSQPSRSNERLFREAEAWIRSADEGVFSFNNICETLGLNPDSLRTGLEHWKGRQLGVRFDLPKRLATPKGRGASRPGRAA